MPRRRENRRSGIDWTDLKRRVDAAGQAVAGDSAVPAERIPRLLEERARELARPILELGPGETPRLITFAIAGEHYAVEPRRVMEISRVTHLAPVPRAEPWVAGLTGWRGELVLVIDLRPLFGAQGAATRRSTMVVLGDDRPRLAMLADAPGELLAVPPDDLRPPPDGLAGREYLRGMTADAVLVLDVERILALVEPEPV
jgi:purine-binding chemotaxis protein CheW